jgi:RND family efflux transporter MFP subunit
MKPPSLPAARLLLFLTAALGLTGCKPPQDEAAMPPPVVSVSLPLERNVADYNHFTGRTAAVDSVQVRARVWGYLKKINFKEGDLVKKDQILFEIDPQTYQTVVDQAQARVALAEAQQNLSDALGNRNKALRLRNALSEEDFEKSEADRATAAASVNSAKADQKRAQLDLDFTQVKAPIGGRVGRAMATVGNLIQSGEMGGTVLTSIVSVDPMWAYFDVDDLTFLRVSQLFREGKVKSANGTLPPVFLGLANEEGYPHEGKIDFVDNQVDPGTGTLRMRGVFTNKDGTLTPGLFARMRVPVGDPHKALLVTDRAVDTDQGQKVVYVVGKDNVVDKRLVRLGGLHDGLREILSGVQAGEDVIVDGIQFVRGGVTVNPKVVDMPESAEGK